MLDDAVYKNSDRHEYCIAYHFSALTEELREFIYIFCQSDTVVVRDLKTVVVGNEYCITVVILKNVTDRIILSLLMCVGTCTRR